MKFLCDRCKTRYSIGDERVRGKILKIRCKNCNNVITVREGMPEIAADEPRRKGQATQAIETLAPGAGANGALGAAFANAMSKPPPALEEEWYVSIEGDQAGPYSLADAQKWVASKPFDADLHCWSEGFDDWLPVDKVSHFRGLRKKPVAPPPIAAPPPIPRVPTAAQRRLEDTPKPLFAATMASLEAATQPPLGSGNFNLPPPAAAPVPASTPHAERSSTKGTPLGGQPAMPASTGIGGLHARGTNGRATPVPASARPTPNPADSATQIDSAPLPDLAPSSKAKPDPLALPRPTDPFPVAAKADPFAQTTPQQAKPDPFATGKATPPPAALDLTQPVGDVDIDDDLNIGEVSRVVNLADLAKQQGPRSNANRATPVPTAGTAAANLRSSGSIPLNRTGNVPALSRTSNPSIPVANRTGSLASIALPAIGPDGKQVDPATGEPIPLAPQVAVSHRRGMIALLVGALVLLGGAAAAVIYIVTSREEGSNGGLVGYDVDTTRPDDPRRTGSAGVSGNDSAQPQNPFVPKPKPRPTNPNPNPNNNNPIPTNPNAKDLRPDEIEDMAAKSSGATQTCWRRSQRGAEAILLADLKKIGVTLTVDKSGVVTNVTLSEHATTSLGKCLSSTIRGWKFRESTAGITARITLVFQGV